MGRNKKFTNHREDITMAFDKKEVAKVLESVTSVTGRPLKYIEKKKVITDAPNNGKGDFCVMKKIGDKRFKIEFFMGGAPLKKDGKGNKIGGSFPTVKGMTSHGVKAKALNRIEVPEEVVVVPEVQVAEPVEVVDVRQTPADRVIDEAPEGVEGMEVAGSVAIGRVSPEYEKHLDAAFGSVGN